MAITFQCPYFATDNQEKPMVCCEIARLNFPDKEARSNYIKAYCASLAGWQSCPLSQCMTNYYDRRDANEKRGQNQRA